MATVIGTVSESYEFDSKEIKRFVCNSAITDAQVQEIANVLAANVEIACDFNDDSTVAIVPENFNDAFFDMGEDLIETYS